MFRNIGVPELLIILVVVLVIFGPGKLPQIGGALGRSLHDFKEAMSGEKKVTPFLEKEEKAKG